LPSSVAFFNLFRNVTRVFASYLKMAHG